MKIILRLLEPSEALNAVDAAEQMRKVYPDRMGHRGGVGFVYGPLSGYHSCFYAYRTKTAIVVVQTPVT